MNMLEKARLMDKKINKSKLDEASDKVEDAVKHLADLMDKMEDTDSTQEFLNRMEVIIFSATYLDVNIKISS